jgi:hypothetical protein
MNGSSGLAGELEIKHTRIPTESMPGHVREWLHKAGYDAETLARDAFATSLHAHHFRKDPKGKFVAGEHFGTADHPFAGEPHVLVAKRDLGPGSITQVGAQFLSQSTNWLTATTPFAGLDAFTYHCIGTGATAAAGTDYFLQTATIGNSLTSPTAGTTSVGYMLGATTTPTAAVATTFKSVATFTAGGALAITEWGLTNANSALSTRVSSTATGSTATSYTDSGAPFLNTGNKMAGWVIEIAGPINTPTTTVFGMVGVNGANSTTVLNLTTPGWQQLAVTGAAASTPGNVAYVVYPCMVDHKVFSVINLVATDTLSFTYTNAISIGT